jgi:hypothetical protein
MRLRGEPATADRALILNELRFELDLIYQLDCPLMLLPGDQVSMRQEQQVVVKRASGREERPAGHWQPWCWAWRLL